MERSKKRNDQELGSDQIEVQEKSNLKGDYLNVAILLFLYMLQGIPLGISAAIPLLLQKRGVSYAEQAGFTFAYYPFTSECYYQVSTTNVIVNSLIR